MKKLEQLINNLCKKYNITKDRGHYLITAAECKLTLQHPITYMFRYKKQRNDAYNLINRYLSIEQFKENKHKNRVYK